MMTLHGSVAVEHELRRLLAKAIAHADNGGSITVTGDGWTHSVIFNRPKRYTFTEAYAMMKRGKWMKANGLNSKPNRWSDTYSCWQYLDELGIPTKFAFFDVNAVDAQWEEVSP